MILLTAFGIFFSRLVPVFFSSSLYLVYPLNLYFWNLCPLMRGQGSRFNQPRQSMEIRDQEIFKSILFVLIGPEEPNMWLAECRVTLISLLVNIDSFCPNLRTNSRWASHWGDAIIQARIEIENEDQYLFKTVSFVLIFLVEPKIQ